MSTSARTGEMGMAAERPRGRAIAGPGFDWAFTAACAWLLGGLYLDGWAHFHQPGLESFFTPWHAVFYSGYGVVVLTLVGVLAINRANGLPWQRALPAGYGGSLFGAILFGLAGLSDMVWHTLFGIERATEALFSPPHLLLGTGGIVMAAGPFRAAWRRTSAGEASWRALGPMVFSLLIVLSALSFFTLYAHPLVEVWSAVGAPGAAGRGSGATVVLNRGLGTASILLQTGAIMGVVLLALRRWRLPPGSLTLVLTINALLMAVLRDTYNLVPAVLCAGLVADALLLFLRPSRERLRQLRLFAFLTPLVYFSLYFAAVQLGPGIGWSVHVWTGTIFMAGMVGLLISCLVFPPTLPHNVE